MRRANNPAVRGKESEMSTLEERALDWCLEEQRRWGDRKPSDDRIAEYLSGCMRHGKPLGLKKANFCSGAQGFAERQVALPGEVLPFWRAAAKEHIADAKKSAALTWLPIEKVLSGEALPPVGAKVIYHRGDPKSWTGHIDRLIELVTVKGDQPTHYRNVGANERGGCWTIQKTPLAHPKLIGFVFSSPSAIEDAEELQIPEGAGETEISEADLSALRMHAWNDAQLSLAEFRELRDRELDK